MLLEYAATELQGELLNRIWRVQDLLLQVSSNCGNFTLLIRTWSARVTQLFSLLQTTKFLICYIVIPIAVSDAYDPLLPNPIAENVNI